MNTFYGNVINPSQFQFDKIYSNRKEMDDSCKTDEIFIGRYVLVKYDKETEVSRIFLERSALEDKFYGYTSINKEEKTKILFENINIKNFYYDYDDNDRQVFYQAEKDIESDYAFFTPIDISSEIFAQNQYFENLNIDKSIYGLERSSYDATVWQKAFINNEEKYVKVAELNSGTPIFSIKTDAPTHYPLTPHFEANTVEENSQKYYKLHIQPSWGFRIAQAQSKDLSDENSIWIKEEYDPKEDKINKKYYNTSKKEWLDYNETDARVNAIPSAIYYNKKGFKKEKRSYDKNIVDEISMRPAKSGNLYSDHDGTESAQDDIQEMRILLPSLGNAISDVWDIVYGTDEERNLDIKWNSLKGLRQTVTEDGYKYDKEGSIETIAGCINSVHDLMGMIIKDIPEGGVEMANEENIYWDNKNKIFSRKKKKYDYSDILTVDKGDYKIQLVKNPSVNYQPNTYYLNAEGTEPDVEGKYNSKKTYYERILQVNYIKLPKVNEYKTNTYYYFDKGNYFLEKQERTWDKDKNYLEIIKDKLTKINFKTNYKINQFYYQEKVNDRNYWMVENSDTPKKDIKYYELQIDLINGIPFISKDNTLFVWNEERKTYTAGPEFYDKNAEYYKLTDEIDSEGRVILNMVEVFERTENHYQQDEFGNYFQNDWVEGNSYYLITKKNNDGYKNTDFYLKDLYHYEKDGDYILGKEENYFKDKNYYVFIENNEYININQKDFLVECVFFEPNVYYLENDSGKKVLSEIYNPEKAYLYYALGEDLYVIADEKSSFNIGSLWNNQITLIPWPVSLARREAINVFEELKGFAKNYNTIHGLILKLNYLMESDDTYTRDTTTIRGAINKLNDIFFKFDQLIPGTSLSIGNNGKIYSTTCETDNWINYELNNAEHKIIIKHESPKDLNLTEVKINDSLILCFDEKGHFVKIK